jgi:hypothetical protein
MKKFLLFGFILLLTISILAGCEKKVKSDGPVLAKVGKGEITQDDFIKEASVCLNGQRDNLRVKKARKSFEELIKESWFTRTQKDETNNDPESLKRLKSFKR